MAYQFLLEDPFLSDPCGQRVEQRYGLATVYFATSGDSWTNNERWLGPVDECTWAGVTCNDNLVVTELRLGKPYFDCLSPTNFGKIRRARVLTFSVAAINGLDGEIPDEILTLVGLRELDVFANSIRGTIPEGMAGLVNLAVLDMQENLLVGPAFPPSVLDLRRLQSYRVNSNALTGPVPSRIGSLRMLQELWAANNEITGSLPTEIGNLRDLKTVLLYENSIQGTLPSELGLIPLEGLWMWGNFFQENIPSQIFNVASLRVSSLMSARIFVLP